MEQCSFFLKVMAYWGLLMVHGVETDAYAVWKMHDRALMQLLIATLSSTAISYVIGCTSSHDMWVQLKDRFSMVTKARIFQMKSELQNIKKGADPVSQYLQKIKDARDHLAAARVSFDDDDIVILALNGLPQNIIHFGLLAEEAILEHTTSATPFASAMMANNQSFNGKSLVLADTSTSVPSSISSSHNGGVNGGLNGGFHSSSNGGSFSHNGGFQSGPNRGSFYRGRGRPRHQFSSSSRPYQAPPNSGPGILGSGTDIPICQICNKKGHLAADCFNDINNSQVLVPLFNAKFAGSKPPSSNLTAMHANCSPSSSAEQFWVADTGATAHMTSDLSQLSLATPFLGNETITTAGGSVTQFSASLKVFQSDGGGEYLSHKFQHYLLARVSPFLFPPPSISFTNTVLSPIPSLSISSPSPSTYEANEPLTALPPSSLPASPSATQSATQSPLPVDPDFQPESLRVVLPLPPVNLHPMTTRSKNGISKRKAFSASTSIDLSTIEPSSFKAASQSPEWQSAMREEIEALHAQGTWDLVPLPAHKNLVGCKWVYRIKKNADGSIARHKARLVAKGFSQEEGIDYYETFSPVVKPTTVRLVLALPLSFSGPYGNLMLKMRSCMVFFKRRLKKSLYGLKQAPRAWNERFTSFLPSLGFQASNADPSLFIHHSSLGTVVLLLYVDDIILTGSNSSLITSVISALTQEFDMKDLGQLTYFLGLQISYQSAGLFVSQTKYIKELLDKVDLQDSKPCPTPCLPYHRLLKDDGKPYSHPEHTSLSQGQILNPEPGLLHLHAYSDADWAGDPNDRRSVSGFIVYLGSSPISWASKKQHTVSRSSTEAEYRALAIAAAELAWIRQLFCDLHVPLHVPPLIHCDNISAIALSSNPVFHSRMKHLQIDYHFVRERVIRGDLHVQHVSSADQFADILTKGLSIPLFQHHCSNLMLGSSKHEIEGACKDIKGPNSATCQKIEEESC
ncbi:hypothetical protein Prudu_016938 [Prunus dulcis]|uniref:CCHC-type domain-containing protein n=1 Tax=Prunus dulcis TaxID=3755 RepID=A0A4Y1RNW0_PRUDU|nr:hypothetical protein Prudu_016938 [Prunus dulcis]